MDELGLKADIESYLKRQEWMHSLFEELGLDAPPPDVMRRKLTDALQAIED